MTRSAPTAAVIASLAVTACGAGTTARPTRAPAAVPVPSAIGDESTSPLPPAPAASETPRERAQWIRATAAMPIVGEIDKDRLLEALNGQLAPLDRCVPMIRDTDGGVGSLNLRLGVAPDGSLDPELQSPVNDDAKRCLLDELQAMSVQSAGAGKAMVLLSLQDQ